MTPGGEFFHRLFGASLEENEQFIELRCINRHDDQTRQEFFPSIEVFLEAIKNQAPRFDYYFGIHPRASKNGTAEAVKYVTCIWADLDWNNFKGGQNEAIARVRKFPIPPTAVVSTGHGIHVYWLMKEPEELEDPADFRCIVKGVQKLLGSDQVDDLSRVLRIPGTLNYKDLENVLPCKIVFFDYSRRYGIPDFEQFAISAEEGSQSHKAAPKIEGIIPKGERNKVLASIAGTMRRRGCSPEAIFAALKEQNKQCEALLPDDELRGITESISRYPPASNVVAFPGQPTASISEILIASGFDKLGKDSKFEDVEASLRSLAQQLQGIDRIQRAIVVEAAAKTLNDAAVPGIKSPKALVKTAMPDKAGLDKANCEQGQDTIRDDPEPHPEPVDGAKLLDDIKAWIGGYVIVSEASLTAIALWVLATWFVAAVFFAPILAILSPTKRSGKTLLLDLLNWICRKVFLTSGVGVTSAVIFRLNEQYQPTFLIDEAEKLSGKDADKQIIGLLNQGYRRGSKVYRCGENHG